MEINYIRTSGWQAAFRGMRNPKNSWNKSDSVYGLIHSESKKDIIREVIPSWVKSMNTDYHYAETVLNNNGVLQEMNDISEVFFIGGADMKLAKSLIKAGSEHRKLLRQIFITFDITAPLYFFKEFDTYKINTTSNSTSTMHTIEKKEITFYAKKYEEVGDYDIWQELVLRKSGDAYLYRTKDGNNVKINCLFNNTFFLNCFFNELISLREYLLLNNYLIYDVRSLYYLSLSSDEIKISEKNRKVKRIPVSYSKDTSEYNDYLSHIYVDKTNLPLWLQEECELIKHIF